MDSSSASPAAARGLTVQQRLMVIVAASLAGILLLAAVLLAGMRSTMIEDRKNAARFAVESAWGVVDAFHKRALSGELTQEEARKQAMNTLRTMRYNGEDYFWINDFGPRMVMHPTKPDLDGKDLSGSKDPNGKALFVEFVAVARTDGWCRLRRLPVAAAGCRQAGRQGVLCPPVRALGLDCRFRHLCR